MHPVKAFLCGMAIVMVSPVGVLAQFHYGFKIGPSISTLRVVEVGEITASAGDPELAQVGYLFELMVGTDLGPGWQIRSG